MRPGTAGGGNWGESTARRRRRTTSAQFGEVKGASDARAHLEQLVRIRGQFPPPPPDHLHFDPPPPPPRRPSSLSNTLCGLFILIRRCFTFSFPFCARHSGLGKLSRVIPFGYRPRAAIPGPAPPHVTVPGKGRPGAAGRRRSPWGSPVPSALSFWSLIPYLSGLMFSLQN